MKLMKRLTLSLCSAALAAGLALTACGSTQNKDAAHGLPQQKNEIVGFDINLTKAATECLGIQLELVPIDWKSTGI